MRQLSIPLHRAILAMLYDLPRYSYIDLRESHGFKVLYDAYTKYGKYVDNESVRKVINDLLGFDGGIITHYDSACENFINFFKFDFEREAQKIDSINCEDKGVAFHRGDEILVSGYIKSVSNPEEHFIMTNKTPATVYKWWNDECLELELESCNWYAHYKQCERVEG